MEWLLTVILLCSVNPKELITVDYDYINYNYYDGEQIYKSSQVVNREITFAQRVFIELELLDFRETSTSLNQNLDDYATIFTRICQLGDTPRLSHSYTFGINKIQARLIMSYMDHYKEYMTYESYLWVTQSDKGLYAANYKYCVEEIEAAQKIRRIYDMFDDINTEYYNVVVRRYALQSLREELGEINFWAGNAPQLSFPLANIKIKATIPIKPMPILIF